MSWLFSWNKWAIIPSNKSWDNNSSTKKKRGQATLFSGILIDIRIPFDKEERGQATLFSGILIDIRITFDIEKRGCVWHSQVFSSNIRIPFDKEKRGQATLFSGILIDIRIPFDKEKRGCVWHSQVFSSTFEYPSTKRNEDKLRCSQVFSSTFEYSSTKRNEDVYDILRYSHQHSNTLRPRKTRMCMAFSGILIIKEYLTNLSIL